MPPSKFRERAAQIAARFLHTVILIDDEAYRYFFRQTESGKVQKIELVEPQLLPGGSSDKSEHASKAEVEETKAESVQTVLSSEEKPVIAGIENATDAEVEQGLNSRKLVANFARHGLVCGVIEPDPDGKDLDQLLVAAQRADVLIVDWVFNDDGGKLAQRIVKSVLANDSINRLRLIIIYTGDPGVAKVLDELKNDAAKGLSKTREKNVLADDRTRIAVLSKVTSPKNKSACVSLDALPERVLVEFAALYSGLVTNAAMEGLAVLRNNTHQLLGRLHKQLDVAFLTHRMLLLQPNAAQEFLTDLVGQEIASLLHNHEVGNVSNMTAIEEWFEVSAKDEPEASKELTAALGAQGDQRLELLRLGAPEFLNAKATKENRRALEEKIHRSGSHMFLGPSKRPTDLDHEFAHVASMVHRYENAHPPRLTLGTVLVSADGEYLVCIQPVCDCVRVSEPRRFAFLTAEKSGAPNLVLKDGTAHIRLKVQNKVAGLVQQTFGPGEGKDVVYGVLDGDSFQFKTVDEKIFTWRGQLKFPQAQRLTQQFSSLLARVGLDESEWLRRFDRTAEAAPLAGTEETQEKAEADEPGPQSSPHDKA